MLTVLVQGEGNLIGHDSSMESAKQPSTTSISKNTSNRKFRCAILSTEYLKQTIVSFVKPHMRRGVLPAIVSELLAARNQQSWIDYLQTHHSG